MTNTREEVADKLIGQARAVFERVTESYYEGDFTKYEPDGDYVCAQQQDDFTMFLSGFQQGLNHMVEKSCAAIAASNSKYVAGLVEALEKIKKLSRDDEQSSRRGDQDHYEGYEKGLIAIEALNNLPEELRQ